MSAVKSAMSLLSFACVEVGQVGQVGRGAKRKPGTVVPGFRDCLLDALRQACRSAIGGGTGGAIAWPWSRLSISVADGEQMILLYHLFDFLAYLPLRRIHPVWGDRTCVVLLSMKTSTSSA